MARIALVTGGAGGLGFATAAQLAKDGLRIVLTDLTQVAAERAVAGLHGTEHLALALDVTSEARVMEVFALIEKTLGPVSVLAHFAGALDGAARAQGDGIADLALASWQRVFDVNAQGTFLLVREMIRWRRKVPVEHGRVITVSSLAGQMGGNLAGAGYASSKAAVLGLTKNVAREVAPLGITVNALAPGAIDTQMYRDAAGLAPTDSTVEGATGIPMKRVGIPDEVGAVAAFLASPAAAYLTGQIIAVNGGSYT